MVYLITKNQNLIDYNQIKSSTIEECVNYLSNVDTIGVDTETGQDTA